MHPWLHQALAGARGLRHAFAMSDLHALGFHAADRDALEAVDPNLTAMALQRAQQRAWKAVAEIYRALRPGLTETEGRALATEILAREGAVKHWHRPHLRFGPGTALTFDDPLQPAYQLQAGDPVYIDLGPVFADALTGLQLEADVGCTLHLGPARDVESARCSQVVKAIFDEGVRFWRAEQPTGAELYEHLERAASAEGYRLIREVHGHRLSEVPHHKYTRAGIGEMQFQPAPGVWVLEVQLVPERLRAGQAAYGAFYEDLLL